MALAGLDIGSTGAKLTVTDDTGNILHTGYKDYPVSRLAHAHEVDANEIWNTVKTLLRDIGGISGITGLGVTSFGESFVLLNEDDEVLLPTMMYTDPRGEIQTRQLERILGAESIAEIAGTLPHSMFSLPKLMWVAQELPDVFLQVRRVCLIADFIVYQLTKTHIIDYSLASRTMGFDINTLEWSQSIFDAAGIDSALFGEPVPSGTKAGRIDPDIAKQLGLTSNLWVVLCGHDQIAACVGSNLVTPGCAANGAGTVECITPIFKDVPANAALQKRNFAVLPFLDSSRYCCYAFSFTGGSLMNWFIAQLASGTIKAEDANIYKELENASGDAPTGILVLPHFAGAATPYMDNGSKGAFLGLELSHTKADLFSAIMEGITYEMKINIEKLAEAGVQISELHTSGGCARSEKWLQMKADILGIPVTRLCTEEAGTIGCILLTGVATGRYSDVEQAANTLAKPMHTYTPRASMHNDYSAHYARYQQVYKAVRPLMS